MTAPQIPVMHNAESIQREAERKAIFAYLTFVMAVRDARYANRSIGGFATKGTCDCEPFEFPDIVPTNMDADNYPVQELLDKAIAAGLIGIDELAERLGWTIKRSQNSLSSILLNPPKV